MDLIERGYAKGAVVGGAESLSNVPIQYSPKMAPALVKASRAKSPLAKAQTLATIRPGNLAPVSSAIAETSTGLSMGESAELMAKVNGISRAEQDAFALESHHRAVAESHHDSRRSLRSTSWTRQLVPFPRMDRFAPIPPSRSWAPCLRSLIEDTAPSRRAIPVR